MAGLFIQYWAIGNKEICPIANKIAKLKLKILPNAL